MKRRTRDARILIIDDDEELARTMVDALESEGFVAWALRPSPATRRATAAAASFFRPDVVLLDVIMPVDTAALLRELRADPALSRAVILGCSGHSALAERLRGQLDGFLHKPFTRGELVEALTEAARAGQVAAPPAP